MLKMLVGTFFGLWLWASAVHQFRFRWWRCASRYDRWGLLPRWTFFAPNPGRHDLHVMWRDHDRHGEWETWQEMELGEGSFARRWLWNPSRFAVKAMSDLANELRQAARLHVEEPRAVTLTPAYLAMLAWVLQAPSRPDATRQFAVVATNSLASEMLDVVFVSEAHSVA